MRLLAIDLTFTDPNDNRVGREPGSNYGAVLADRDFPRSLDVSFQLAVDDDRPFEDYRPSYRGRFSDRRAGALF